MHELLAEIEQATRTPDQARRFRYHRATVPADDFINLHDRFTDLAKRVGFKDRACLEALGLINHLAFMLTYVAEDVPAEILSEMHERAVEAEIAWKRCLEPDS